MSTHDDRRRGQDAGRQGPSQGGRPARQRRAPLFALEADDIPPSTRHAPPEPLGELLGDIDAMLPSRPLSRRDDEADPRARSQRPPAPGASGAVRSTSAQAAEDSASWSDAATAGRSASASRHTRGPSAGDAVRPSTRDLSAGDAARPQQTQRAAQQTITRTAPPRPQQDLRTAPLADLLAEQLPSIDSSRARLEAAEAHLTRMELSEARPRLAGYAPPPAPALSLSTGVMLVVICLASLLVLLTIGGRGATSYSNWNLLQRVSEAGGASPNTLVAAASAGDYALKRPPSITPQQIDRILESYNSPAVGTGQDWYNLGLQYGIDPAFAVAFFIHESSAGSNPNWAGIKPGGGTTHNVGNIICAGYATCYGRFRDYPSWAEGIEDWYRLIDVEYIQGRGHQTVADVIPVYAPAFENDVQGYVNAVHRLIDQWRSEGSR